MTYLLKKIPAIIPRTLSIIKNYSSVLFIPGNKANETFSFLSPYLDFDKRFSDIEKLKRELELRGLKIDPLEMKECWEFYKYTEANRHLLEERRVEIKNKMEVIMKKKDLTKEEQDEINALNMQSKVLKLDLKMIKQVLWDLQDSIVVRVLNLPNEIDEQTPERNYVLKIAGRVPELPEEKRKNHLQVGKDLGVVTYSNNLHYFFHNEATLLELGTLELLGKILSEDMIRVAGCDFSRSIVIEGSGQDHEDPNLSFHLREYCEEGKKINNRMHLVGSASLISFLAMFTKNLINPHGFPIKYFSIGKEYLPPRKSELPGLFNGCQSTAAHAYVMVKNYTSEEYKNEFENLVKKVMKFYDSLEIHYRVVMRSVRELQSWESSRVSFECWSVFHQQYVEVGFISGYRDFISKRLLIAYQTNNGREFPVIISGTVFSFPKFFACLLEQNPMKLEIPQYVEANTSLSSAVG